MECKYLIVIVGPTASGKTKLAIEVAHHFATEIISCDSRQFYKELNIGTAKPSPEEQAAVRHYFVDNLSIFDQYDVGKFEQEALSLLASKFAHTNKMVMVGGSGLYVKAVCEGFDEMPEIAPGIREAYTVRFKTSGLDSLVEELRQKDPIYYRQVDKKNPQRIIRALEVIEATGQPYSSFRKSSTTARPFECIKVGISIDRELLYQRIDQRMDNMLAAGLMEEARNLHQHRHLNALQTVGYTELFDYFEGKYDEDEAIRLLKRNSRRYAKRQLTWFAKDTSITWFSPDETGRIVSFIEAKMPK